MNVSLRVGKKVDSLQNAEEVLDCLRAPQYCGAAAHCCTRPRGIS